MIVALEYVGAYAVMLLAAGASIALISMVNARRWP